MSSIGVRELKEHTGEILRRVREQGEELEVTYHGRAIARLTPIRSAPAPANLTTAWADLDRLAVEIGARWSADEANRIAPHEPQAGLLSAEDVDRDVAALSEALVEERARRIARNVLLRSEVRRTLEIILASGVCQSEEEAVARGLTILSMALTPVVDQHSRVAQPTNIAAA